MSRKTLVLLVVAAVTLGLAFAVSSGIAASEKGPAEITLNADGKKPAAFPHAAHQEKFDCGTCHHKVVDGVPSPCDDGSPLEDFQKCDSCHKAGFQNEALDSWKEIGHARCKSCHTEMKDQGAPTKCGACHPKK